MSILKMIENTIDKDLNNKYKFTKVVFGDVKYVEYQKSNTGYGCTHIVAIGIRGNEIKLHSYSKEDLHYTKNGDCLGNVSVNLSYSELKLFAMKMWFLKRRWLKKSEKEK